MLVAMNLSFVAFTVLMYFSHFVLVTQNVIQNAEFYIKLYIYWYHYIFIFHFIDYVDITLEILHVKPFLNFIYLKCIPLS